MYISITVRRDSFSAPANNLLLRSTQKKCGIYSNLSAVYITDPLPPGQQHEIGAVCISITVRRDCFSASEVHLQTTSPLRSTQKTKCGIYSNFSAAYITDLLPPGQQHEIGAVCISITVRRDSFSAFEVHLQTTSPLRATQKTKCGIYSNFSAAQMTDPLPPVNSTK